MTELAHSSFKEFLLGALKDNIVTVEFTKKDGSKRVMKCTRNKDSIPAEMYPKNEESRFPIDWTNITIHQSKPIRSKPDNIVPVFDTEAKGWRSLTLETIISVDGVDVSNICK